jgi:hypothetical protein
VKGGPKARHWQFLLACTLTYAFVFFLAEYSGWRLSPDLLDMLFGSLTAGVVAGSLLLPFFHSLIFGTDRKAARAVALWLVLSWYGVSVLAWADDALNVTVNVDYLFVAIALWQGIYLRRMK